MICHMDRGGIEFDQETAKARDTKLGDQLEDTWWICATPFTDGANIYVLNRIQRMNHDSIYMYDNIYIYMYDNIYIYVSI